MNSEIKGLSVLLLGAAFLGFSAIFVKWANPASPLMVGFYRMAFALPCVLLISLRSPKGTPASQHSGLPWAILAAICFTGDLALWYTAMHYTTAASATLLSCIAPLWVALAMVLFFGAHLRRRAWIGLALALGGAACMAIAKGIKLSGNLGELLGLLSSLCYAGYTLALSRARRTMSAVQILLWVVLADLVIFGMAAFFKGDAFRGFPAHAWLSLVGLGLLVQAGGWWCITWGFGHVSTHVGAVGLLMQSVTTVILGWVMLHESLLPVQALGTALILIGIGLCSGSPPIPRRITS
jgi:drug/metabolite transporter (DMT)-like permease